MEKYRKKPIVIEAIKYQKSKIGEMKVFCPKLRYNPHDNEYYIDTLEGCMLVTEDDYIIKGVKGEFYPCKSDIFKQTYDLENKKQFNAEKLKELINILLDEMRKGGVSRKDISDGYHTFDELYYHRMILFSLLLNSHPEISWKSKKHHDGTMFDDESFICGIETPKGQYTYHYHLKFWNNFRVKELEFAPEYDGHKPSDITRLLSLKGE